MTNAVLTACRLRPDTDRASVRRVINDAYLDVALELDLTQTSKPVSFVSGQSDYNIPNDFGITNLLSISSIIGPASGSLANVEMEATYPSRLLELRSNSTVSNDAPWMYALYGIETLMLYPSPTSATQATIYYTAEPDPLFDDGDIPSLLPTSFHRVIEDRAIELAARRWARNLQLAADAHASYEAGMGDCKSWLSSRDGVWPKEVATLSTMHRLRRRPHDRSTDTGWWQ